MKARRPHLVPRPLLPVVHHIFMHIAAVLDYAVGEASLNQREPLPIQAKLSTRHGDSLIVRFGYGYF